MPTVLNLQGISVPEVVDGRPINEALIGGPSPSEITVKSDRQVAETVVGNVKYTFTLHKSYVGGTVYVDSTVTTRQYD